MHDMKKTLERLQELYVDEIEKINKKGELTPAEGEAGHKALEALCMIDQLCEKEEEKEFSQRMAYGNGPMPYSERRGRNALGQYTSRVMNKLDDIRKYDAHDGFTRRAINRCMDDIEENQYMS